jgi:hypothetical protein
VDGVLVGASSLWPKSQSPRLDPILTGPKWEVNCHITLNFSQFYFQKYISLISVLVLQINRTTNPVLGIFLNNINSSSSSEH